MTFHRNSQKRYYIPGAMCFITMNTRDRQPFFKEDILCRLFLDEIDICRVIKECGIIAYKVNPDHIHIIIQPSGKANYSECIRSLRTNFSRNVNRVIERSGDDMDPERIIAKTVEKKRPIYNPDAVKPGHVTRSDAAFTEMIKRHSELLNAYRDQFRKKYHGILCMPVFRWQSRFHDHIIRNKDDLANHIRYLEYQWINHGLRENKWLWIREDFTDMGK